MKTVVKHTQTIEEYVSKVVNLTQLAQKAYNVHKEACEVWQDGTPVKAYFKDGCDLVIVYESGRYFHYNNLDTSHPTWW